MKNDNLGGISFENFEDNLKKANEDQINHISLNIIKGDNGIPLPFGTSRKWKDGRWYKKVYGGWIPDVEKNKREQELKEKIEKEEFKEDKDFIEEAPVMVEEAKVEEEPKISGIDKAIDAIKQARIDGLIEGISSYFLNNSSINDIKERLKLFAQQYTEIKNS